MDFINKLRIEDFIDSKNSINQFIIQSNNIQKNQENFGHTKRIKP